MWNEVSGAFGFKGMTTCSTRFHLKADDIRRCPVASQPCPTFAEEPLFAQPNEPVRVIFERVDNQPHFVRQIFVEFDDYTKPGWLRIILQIKFVSSSGSIQFHQ